ncbi:MAG: hypothetical protein AAF288_09565 [Planctomycetota bacterium]
MTRNLLHRFQTPALALAVFAGAGAGATLPAATASAQGADLEREIQQRKAAEDREFSKLLAERNKLYRQLYDLDARAAAELAAGREALTVNAQQAQIQDQIDRSEFRLGVLAIRLDRAIPDPPSEPNSSIVAPENNEPYRANFDRGRSRAVALLQRKTEQVLQRIDYGPLLRADG